MAAPTPELPAPVAEPQTCRSWLWVVPSGAVDAVVTLGCPASSVRAVEAALRQWRLAPAELTETWGVRTELSGAHVQSTLVTARPAERASGDDPEVPLEAMDLGLEQVDCVLTGVVEPIADITGLQVDCAAFLAEPTLAATATWTWSPGSFAGEPVPAPLRHRVSFQVYPPGEGGLSNELFGRLRRLHIPGMEAPDGVCRMELRISPSGIPERMRTSALEQCLLVPVGKARVPRDLTTCTVRFSARRGRARQLETEEKACLQWMRRIDDWRWLSRGGQRAYEVSFSF